MVPSHVVAAVRTADRPVCAYIYDRQVMRENVQLLRAALPDGTKIAYALKANGDARVMAALLGVVDGFEVASGGELAAAVAAGSRFTVFSGPAKTDTDLRAAGRAGAIVNVESLHELRRITLQQVYDQPRVCLRVNRSHPALPGSHAMAGVPTAFGIDETQLPEAVAIARAAGIRLAGFHLHAVSNNMDAAAHAAYIVDAARWASEAARRWDITAPIVNVGGGFGVDITAGPAPSAGGQTGRVAPTARIEASRGGTAGGEASRGEAAGDEASRGEAAGDEASRGEAAGGAGRVLPTALIEASRDEAAGGEASGGERGGVQADGFRGGGFDLGMLRAGLGGLRLPDGGVLVVEPGRAVAATGGWYATEVIDVKQTHGRWFVVVRGGTHHFRLPASWGYSHPFTVVPVDDWPYPFERPGVSDVDVDVAGEQCNPRDVLARGARVGRVRAGDVLVFANTGAYGWEVAHHDFLRHAHPQFVVL